MNSRVKATLSAVALLVLVTLCRPVKAQNLEPRFFMPLPVGVDLLTVGWTYSVGDLLLDPAIPVEGVDAEIHQFPIAYAHTLSILGRYSRLEGILPLARATWSGREAGASRDSMVTRSGITDPMVRAVINLYGGKAMSAREFAQSQQHTIVGLVLRLSLPLGQYNPEKLLNLGTNRWRFSPRIGVSRRIDRFIFEAFGSVWLFSTNSESFGGNVVAQDPMWVLQGHAVYIFGNRGAWAGVSIGHTGAGQTIVNGTPRHDEGRAIRLGASAGIPITRSSGVRIVFTSGVSARFGNDFDTIAVVLSHRWL